MSETVPHCERPYLGFGLGLRTDHYEAILSQRPEVGWFEAISENYMGDDGEPLNYLDSIREDYPMVMHGVSLSVGGNEPLDQDYLRRLKALAERMEPEWISDHMCWKGLSWLNMHDQLPLPYTEEAMEHVAARIRQVQDFLGRQILLENVASYVTYTQSCMSEWEFLSTVAERADCLILLDINNLHVSSVNHEFDPRDYLRGVPAERVWQFHLAGQMNDGGMVAETHDHPVTDPVWDLYAEAVRQLGAVSTMIERDENIPPLDALLAELDVARGIAQPILKEAAA